MAEFTNIVKYPSIPKCLDYHPKSDLHGRSGYYPTISDSQLAAVNSLYNKLEAGGYIPEFNYEMENEFLKLLRFLRARKFNVDQAFTMISEDIKWRREDDRMAMRNHSAQQILGCDPVQVCQYFPTWIQGVDKQSRPISWRHFGKFEIWKITEHTTIDKLIKFHAWESEQSLRYMTKHSEETGYNIETFFLVIDAAGWSVSLATGDAFTFIKGMCYTDSDHYPERLGTVMIINAPFMISWVWKIIQGFIDDVTKAKVKIFSSRTDWEPELFNLVDRDQAPAMYGGTLPDPTNEDFIKSMDPPGLELDSEGVSGDGI